MKKAAIAAALILTTGLTALSITKTQNKTAEVKVKVENLNVKTIGSINTLATAD